MEEYYLLIIKIIGICILAIVIFGIGGFFYFYINGFGLGPFAPFIEKVLNEKPEAKITAYLETIKGGDTTKALTIWELPYLEDPHSEEWKSIEGASLLEKLEKRRKEITKSLIESSIKSFEIIKIEWWSTCCIPGVIDDSRNAGGARVYIQLFDSEDNKYTYVFDVFVRGTTYWGEAAGYPVRHWVLHDVYLSGQESIFWQF